MKKNKCTYCKEKMNKGSVKCPHCGSYQDFRRYITLTNALLSLILAVAAFSTYFYTIPTKIVDFINTKFEKNYLVIDSVSNDYLNIHLSNFDPHNLHIGKHIACWVPIVKENSTYAKKSFNQFLEEPIKHEIYFQYPNFCDVDVVKINLYENNSDNFVEANSFTKFKYKYLSNTISKPFDSTANDCDNANKKNISLFEGYCKIEITDYYGKKTNLKLDIPKADLMEMQKSGNTQQGKSVITGQSN